MADLSISGGRLTERPGRQTVALDGHLIVPGLINAHDHLHLNNLQAPDLGGPFSNSYEWGDAFSAQFDAPWFTAAMAVPQRIRHRHGGLKNLLSGATTVLHHDPWDPILADPSFPVRVVQRFGWCHTLRWAGRHGPALVASHRDTPTDQPWLIHLGEGVDAIARGELDALDAAGCLTEQTVLIHAVALDDEATEKALRRGASVVWCPSSNAAVLGATLDPRPWLAARRIALGTDSRASGDATMLAELRAAQDASGLPARSIFEIATQVAADVLRLDDAGFLRPGLRADLLILEDDGDDPYEQVLRARRSDLLGVFVGGRLLLASPAFERSVDPDGPRCDITLDGVPRRVAVAAVGDPSVARQEPGLT